MQICSVNIGKAEWIEFAGKGAMSAITKNPIHTQVFLSTLGLQGDEQANRIRHGGPDKALCAYPEEHYEYWEHELSMVLPLGSFGENLTVQGMRESEIHIGDIFMWGEVLLEVTQPRPPCHKLAKKFHNPQLPLLFQNQGRTGYYMRVLQEGWVSIESPFACLKHHPDRISIATVNHVMYKDIWNKELLVAIIKVEALSASCRTTFELRLAGQHDDSENRLQGM
ncbi:6-N-hydroxylaminopurine resistance protein [compost metagenome]